MMWALFFLLFLSHCVPCSPAWRSCTAWMTSCKGYIECSHFKTSSTDSKNYNHFVQRNKQYHKKVLLSSFHLNGHTLGFHTMDLKVRTTLYSTITVQQQRSQILGQNFKDDSNEVMEGVTLTPEIIGCKILFSLSFSKQIQSTLTANVVNLI